MILAIDTSTARLGIAVFNGTEVLAENCWTSPNRHTVSLAPAVDEMLTNLEIEKKKLKAIAVALGPGSFTSLRVGLSFAKGISLGLGIPVIGVPTLDITANQQPLAEMPLCAFLQAGRGKLAASFYEVKRSRWTGDGNIEVYTAETLSDTITVPTILTGWLWLRWPYFSLYVLAPPALARSWLPIHIPNIGLSPSIAFRRFATVMLQN